MRSIVCLAAAALCLATAGTASAHHLWLEIDGQGAKLYFGEFADNLREASPGALDKLQPTAKALSASGERPLKVEKTANSFALSGKLEAGDSVVGEDTRYPSCELNRDGAKSRGIYWPAARFVPDRAPRTPALTLDVVPVAGDKFQVVFKGKPLAKAKVSVITPSGWGREERTGEDGTFAIALPWRGAYVFEVQLTDKAPGKRGEEAYDQASYVTSLTVLQPQGIEPLPAPPPAKPH